MTTPPSLPALRRVAWLAILVTSLTGCGADGTIGPVAGSAVNTPVVGMNPGQFGFAVTARQWTTDQIYTPDLATGALQVGLSIAGYSGGTGQLVISDADAMIVLSQNLAGNVAQGSNAVVRGRAPFHVRIVASNYTGIISLGVNAAAPAGT